MNRGIRVLQTRALPLGYVATLAGHLCPAIVLARVAGFEPANDGIRIRCLTAWRYPIIWRRHPDLNWGIKVLQTFALPLGHGTKKWSGRRDSDPRHPPWQGGTLPAELLPQKYASGRNRTTDTKIFSLLLYRLSYRGIHATRKGLEPSTSSVTG